MYWVSATFLSSLVSVIIIKDLIIITIIMYWVSAALSSSLVSLMLIEGFGALEMHLLLVFEFILFV